MIWSCVGCFFLPYLRSVRESGDGVSVVPFGISGAWSNVWHMAERIQLLSRWAGAAGDPTRCHSLWSSSCWSTSQIWGWVFARRASSPSLVQLPVTPRIVLARILEWGAIPFSRGSSEARGQSWVSWIAGRLFPVWATREAQIISK